MIWKLHRRRSSIVGSFAEPKLAGTELVVLTVRFSCWKVGTALGSLSDLPRFPSSNLKCILSRWNIIPAVSGRIVGLFQNTCLFLTSFGLWLVSGLVEMLDEDFCEIAWKNFSSGISETGVAGSKKEESVIPDRFCPIDGFCAFCFIVKPKSLRTSSRNKT